MTVEDVQSKTNLESYMAIPVQCGMLTHYVSYIVCIIFDFNFVSLHLGACIIINVLALYNIIALTGLRFGFGLGL